MSESLFICLRALCKNLCLRVSLCTVAICRRLFVGLCVSVSGRVCVCLCLLECDYLFAFQFANV